MDLRLNRLRTKAELRLLLSRVLARLPRIGETH